MFTQSMYIIHYTYCNVYVLRKDAMNFHFDILHSNPPKGCITIRNDVCYEVKSREHILLFYCLLRC